MNEGRYREAERALWSRYGLAPDEQRVGLTRNRTTVRIQEVGEGPPVLFIHGGPNSGSTWVPLVAHLPGVRCILLDRPGTGLSDPLPEPLTLDRAPPYGVRLVEDVLDALELDRAHLLGSSFGGHLALHAAAGAPARVDHMVQLGCPAMAPGMATPPFMRAMALAPVRRLLGMLPPTKAGGRSTLRQIGHRTSLRAGVIPDEFLDWYLALQRDTDTMANETATIASGVTLRGFTPELTIADEVLDGVKCPTSLIWGADDTFGSETVATALEHRLADAELHVLARAGHLPWIDEPELCGELIGAFLSPGK